MLKSTHVVPAKQGGWNVKAGNSQKASAHFDTKQQAVDRGREISRNKGSEFFIHGRNGKIQTRDSHGNDPRRTKG